MLYIENIESCESSISLGKPFCFEHILLVITTITVCRSMYNSQPNSGYKLGNFLFEIFLLKTFARYRLPATSIKAFIITVGKISCFHFSCDGRMCACLLSV